jgi:predicted RNase H-like HicB family nuclease
MQDQTRLSAFGFPTCPAVSAGDDMDEALRNAPEAIALYADSLARERRLLPHPRTLSALKNDPAVAQDMRDHVVALVSVPSPADAAE